MCELSSKDLYLALIDDINEYTGKIKNEEIEKKENCSKLEHAISVLYNLKAGKKVKIYIRKLLDILNNINIISDEILHQKSILLFLFIYMKYKKLFNTFT